MVVTHSKTIAQSGALVGHVDPNSLLLALIVLLPLFGVIVLAAALRSPREKHWQSGWIAFVCAVSSFGASSVLFYYLVEGLAPFTVVGWQWIKAGLLDVSFSLRMDELSGVMALVVTGVGSLIHLYAIGYMADDANRPRFFCYLNLFLFAMLLLVLGDNLLVMFVGWEGVGLCSYLLIGFWHEQMPNAKAGQKAFVVNRIGDAGFLLGIFLLFWTAGTLDFSGLKSAVDTIPSAFLEAAAILLFIGAVGKSAQVPLYVWLPDAMAGPTPVSALIHAATMVTAGIYMMARMSFLYETAPYALIVIACVGAFTALVAASIAIVQNDIKKVLAYSTVSQLGYMCLAMGAGAFSFGIYHVVTHAFFKGLLFMAAGSVIVGCHHTQDMRHFGGLWDKMWGTFLAYLVGVWALAGLPFGAGAYSKDGILWAVFSSDVLSKVVVYGNLTLAQLLWGVATFTALLTAFYAVRSLVVTFFGPYRGSHEPHESPWVMLVPLAPLMVLSFSFGFSLGDVFLELLEPWTRVDLILSHEELLRIEGYRTVEHFAVAAAIAGAVLGMLCYAFGESLVVFLTKVFSPVYYALEKKWWVDELYELILLRPLHWFAGLLFRVVDRQVIDGSCHAVALIAWANAEIAGRLQNGKIGTYLMVMTAGSLLMTLFWLLP